MFYQQPILKKKDAMKIIGYIHDEMKKDGKEAEYDKILLKHFSKDVHMF